MSEPSQATSFRVHITVGVSLTPTSLRHQMTHLVCAALSLSDNPALAQKEIQRAVRIKQASLIDNPASALLRRLTTPDLIALFNKCDWPGADLEWAHDWIEVVGGHERNLRTQQVAQLVLPIQRELNLLAATNWAEFLALCERANAAFDNNAERKARIAVEDAISLLEGTGYQVVKIATE